MRMRQVCVLSFVFTIAITIFHPSIPATRAKGYTSISLAKGQMDALDICRSVSHPMAGEEDEQLVRSMRKHDGLSDIYVQSNVWAPGGSTGWHSHPGPSLIIVTAGAVTDYEGRDPDCKPHVYKTEMAFVDPGGDHIHTLRNEGDVDAKTIAVQFIPATSTRRIDVADPGNCHF